jgi:hypothetical protein
MINGTEVLKQFAEQNRFRTRKDGCGNLIMPGKFSAKDMPKRPEYTSHVYDGFADGKLGICLMFTSARKWGYTRRALQALGCELRQHGDTEGCLTFDPANADQLKAVIRFAGLKRIRKASAAQLANLVAKRKAA